jgi:hypothetical protein
MRRVCRETNHRHTSAWVYPYLLCGPFVKHLMMQSPCSSICAQHFQIEQQSPFCLRSLH